MSSEQNKVSIAFDSAVKEYNADRLTDDIIQNIMDALIPCIVEEGTLFIPIDVTSEHTEQDDIVEYRICKLNFEGRDFFPAYTSQFMIPLDEDSNYLERSTLDFFQDVLKFENVHGVVLNPWTNKFFLPSDIIKLIFREILREEL